MRSILVTAVILASATILAQAARGNGTKDNKESRTPRLIWLEHDSEAFMEVRAAFAEELTPDDPARVAPRVAYRHKYIARVGVVGDAALVLVGHRETAGSSYGDFFEAYNFDRLRGIKSPIPTTSPMWRWTLLRTARFAPGVLPDVVFTYRDCLECESTMFLASFHFDDRLKSWRVRRWNKDDAIWVDSDPQYGDEGTYFYECLFAVADFTGDRLDDTAVRCRESIETDTGKPSVSNDETRLYTVRHGRGILVPLSRPATLRQIQEALCGRAGPHSLCRNRN